MKIDIKPQDKRATETLEMQLHPDLIQRLRSYAESLDKSDVNYVLTQILEQVLPAAKSAKRSKKERSEKHPKEASGKAA